MDAKSYDEALSELQRIVEDMQAPDLQLDELGPKVARARELIRFCRQRLREVEEEVDQLTEENASSEEGE